MRILTTIALCLAFTSAARAQAAEASGANEVTTEPAINHPGWYASSAGLTGYTLGAGEFEVQAGLNASPFSYYLQRNSPWNLFTLANVRYGIVDSLTIDAGAGAWSAEIGARWKIFSARGWSFSVQPVLQFQLLTYSSGFGTTQDGVQETLSLAASYELNSGNHLHLTVEGGDFAQTEDYQNSFVGYSIDTGPIYADYQAKRTSYGGRAAVEFEHRFNYRHGMSFWLAAQVAHYQEQDTSDGVSGFSELDFFPTAGLGYVYTRETFWFLTGIELGPVSVIRSDLYTPGTTTPSGYTYHNVGTHSATGTLNLAVGWRI